MMLSFLSVRVVFVTATVYERTRQMLRSDEWPGCIRCCQFAFATGSPVTRRPMLTRMLVRQFVRKIPYRQTKCIDATTTKFHAMKKEALNQTG